MNPIFKNVMAAAIAVAWLTAPAFSASPGGLMYVPLGSAGEVVIVETGRDAITGKIKGLPAVHGLAGTPDGRFLIAGSYKERSPGVAAPAKPAGVSADEHAAHHAAPPAGAKKARPAVSTVSIVRTADGSVVRRIDVPGAVHHVTVSPNGRLAAVTHPNGGGISVIDLRSYEVVAGIATGPLPNYAAFSPDSKQLYVSNAGNDTVSAIDTAQWIVRWNAPVGASPEHVVLSSDGGALHVNNIDDGTVSVLDTASGKVVKTIKADPSGSPLHGIDLSDDGKTLFVALLGEDKIAAIDLATGNRRVATLKPAPYHLTAVRGTGKLYVSSSDEPKIWVVDQKSLAVMGEIPIGGKGHQMVQRLSH